MTDVNAEMLAALKVVEGDIHWHDNSPTRRMVRAVIAKAEGRMDVASIRNRTGLSQTEFAKRVGVPVATLRNWEQGHRAPNEAAKTLLRLVGRAVEEAANV